MQTVFSHIVQKRFSLVNEDVATDALAFILESSEASRNGMLKLLRGIEPTLPPLLYKTQQVEGAIRPDMWGYSNGEPRVFIENKFWAGLTDNQPVSYLQQLAGYSQPTVLLVVAPSAREHTLWRELKRRLTKAGIDFKETVSSGGTLFIAETQTGPKLALASWDRILSVMEHEAINDTRARSDLVQLRALCDASNNDAFTPISLFETSNQRTPSLVIQLGKVVQEIVDKLIADSVINTNNLRPQASWDRIGRYARLSYSSGLGIYFWIGLHFDLWKTYGATPLWIVFINDDYGLSPLARSIIEPWVSTNGYLKVNMGNTFGLGLEVLNGEEKQAVVQKIVDQIKELANVLSNLRPTAYQSKTQSTDLPEGQLGTDEQTP